MKPQTYQIEKHTVGNPVEVLAVRHAPRNEVRVEVRRLRKDMADEPGNIRERWVGP